MRRRKITLGSLALVLAASIITSFSPAPPVTNAADHRDSTINDARPEGDMPDVFAHISPNDPSKLVLSMNVNPFAVSTELPSYRLANDYLYQIKIDNNGDAVEDFVVQFTSTAGAQQPYEVRFGAPTSPQTPRYQPVMDQLLNVEPICRAISYHGSVNGDSGGVNPSLPEASPTPTPSATPTPNPGPAGGRKPVLGRDGSRCFVGIRDDPFVTDVAQAVFRIGLNPNPRRNYPNHEQDVFRENDGTGATPAFGPVRGRPQDPLDLNSGVDGFGGFNATVLSVEIPVNWVRSGQTGNAGLGAPPTDAMDIDGDGNTTEGIVDVTDSDGDGNTTETIANAVPACPGCINVWGTASIAASDNGNERLVRNMGQVNQGPSVNYQQFERMGQQLFNTVWVWQQPPANSVSPYSLNDSEMKNFKNQLAPEHDVANFGYLIPDALVAIPVYGEDSISQRRQLLASGFYTRPGTGVPFYLDQLAPPFNAVRTGNADKRLLERLLLPDVLRLDLNRPSSVSPALPGAQASNNSGHDLGALQFGLQNGRRTPDDVTDIVLRLGRELADVCYTPAGEALPGRRCLRCQSAAFPATPPSICSDARVTAVLQGTDFIEPDTAPSIGDPLGAINNTADSGNDRQLNTEFPFFASQHPVPGEAGEDTTGYPRLSDPAIIVFGGRPNDNQVNR
ncbi:MAG TPA: DUF4331 family protein [Pyrinomonadaceae bacterium]